MNRLLLIIATLLIVLTGCAHHRPVQGAFPRKPSETLGGGAVGTVAGVAAGSMTGGALALTTAVASTFGASYGNWYQHAPGLAKRLAAEGGQLIILGNKLLVLLPTDYYFKPNSSQLKPGNQATLDAIADLLQHYGDRPIVITGYTDTVATEQQNTTQSEFLAQRVATYLWTRGIPLQRMHVVAAGESLPIASNRHPLTSTYNRRVAISIG